MPEEEWTPVEEALDKVFYRTVLLYREIERASSSKTERR
jgi:hypothetical protein